MKITLFLLLTSMLMEICSAQTSINEFDTSLIKSTDNPIDTTLLEFYRQYSSFTDPGEYEYLYENLPDSLSELCYLIKSQSIHPYAELPKYRELLPKERWNEYFRYPTVESVLKGLYSYDSSGFTLDRKIEDRLVLICRHNSLLLASILKHHGIPARVRYGHATYLIPNFHASHVVCEVWNENDNRWMLVDPSTGMIDFSKDEFDFSNDAWLQMQSGEIDPNLFGIPRRYTGSGSIVSKVCADLASVLGSEYPTNKYAPILDYAIEEDRQLTAENIETLNRISELMKSIDAKNLSELQEIYNNTPEIQLTKSIESVSTNSGNSTKPKNN